MDHTTRLRVDIERAAVNRPLYRYLEAAHARQLLVAGTIKVTTLHSCRMVELGPERTDPDEGRKNTVDLIDDLTVNSPTQLPPFAREAFRVPEGRSTRLTSVIIEHIEDTDDYYILCLSRRFNLGLMRDFGADACVRIDRPEEFFIRLTTALGSRIAERGTMAAIRYAPRSGQYAQVPTVPGAWIKHPKYSQQEEVRCLWTPAMRPIRPEIVHLSAPHEVLYPEHLPD